MAKPGVTFTLLCLLFFFAFSHARLASDLTQNEIFTKEPAEILPQSDPKNSTNGQILLPSEKPDSDPEKTTLQVKLDENDANDAVPLTFVSFRPVNRHFPRRPFPFTLRHGHRCRGHSMMMKPWGPQRRSYGNDMILSTGDRQGSEPVVRGGGGGVVRQIPARWIKIRHLEPRFPLRHGDEIEWPHHKHHHHHDHDRKQDSENVFVKSFRKFMNHF